MPSSGHSSGDSERKYVSEEVFEGKHEVTSTETGQKKKKTPELPVFVFPMQAQQCTQVFIQWNTYIHQTSYSRFSTVSFTQRPKGMQHSSGIFLTGVDIFILSAGLYLAVFKSRLYLRSQKEPFITSIVFLTR